MQKKNIYSNVFVKYYISHVKYEKKTNGLSWTDNVWISVSCLFFHTWCLVWYIGKSLVHVKWHSICELLLKGQIEFFLLKNKDFSPAKTERYFLLQLSHDMLLYPLTSLWKGPWKATAAASHLFGRVRSKTVACVAVTPAPSSCLLVPHHIIHLYTSNQHCSISTLVNNIRMGRGAAVW